MKFHKYIFNSSNKSICNKYYEIFPDKDLCSFFLDCLEPKICDATNLTIIIGYISRNISDADKKKNLFTKIVKICQDHNIIVDLISVLASHSSL